MDTLLKLLRNFIYKLKIYYAKYGIDLNEFHNLLFIISFLFGLVFLYYLIFILFTIFNKKNKTKQEIVLLLGPCESGKTTFLFKLKTDKLCRTITSMKENKAFIFLKNKKKQRCIQFVDFPGHPKLSHSLNKYFSSTKIIIYILDSSDRQSLKIVAEKLCELFTNKVIVQRKIPFIIVCNKTDLCNSRPKQVIKEDLEREIEILKMSKYSSLEEEDDNDETENFLGANSEFFRFEKAPCHIEICSASVKNDCIDEIMELIEKYF